MSKQLRRAFVDIVNGWSPIRIGDIKAIVKHLSYRDHLDLEEIQDRYLEHALENGLPNLKSREKHLVSVGLWSDKKERAILDQKAYVKGMVDGKKNIHLPSILSKISEQIKQEELKLFEMEREKSDLIGLTAEAYSVKRCNAHYIFKSIYHDTRFCRQVYSEETFDDLTDSEVSQIVSSYNYSTSYCSDFNIKKLSIQEFYQAYYYLCEDDFQSFFGKPICDFTFYQIKLANYSRYFKHILEGTDIKSLPERIQNDPDELIAYLDVKKKGEEMINQNSSGRTSLVGATKEDIKALTGNDRPAQLPQKPMNMMEMMKEMKK